MGGKALVTGLFYWIHFSPSMITNMVFAEAFGEDIPGRRATFPCVFFYTCSSCLATTVYR